MSNLETESIRWDLSNVYAGIEDPKLDQDVEALKQVVATFKSQFSGHLETQLGDALRTLADIDQRSSKIYVYLFLLKSLDASNTAVSAKQAAVEMKIQPVVGENLAFFEIEVASLSEEAIESQVQTDAFVAQHRPLLNQMRVFRKYQLSEPVESALAKRSMFGTASWSTFYSEAEARLLFSFEGKDYSVEEIFHLISTSQDANQRAQALAVVNEGLGKHFTELSAFTLFQVTAAKKLEDSDRGYANSLTHQNLLNRVPDDTVEALHVATNTTGAAFAQRYYALKAKILGVPTLRWSDRNAPLPFSDETRIPFPEALTMVASAYQKFSPTLAGIVKELVAQKRIDAHVTPNRESGAYNYSGVFGPNQVESFTFLNYLGSRRDVMTLAHELGHAVHGVLAGRAQGVLQAHPPIAYCETASIFGEMMAFQYFQTTATTFEEKMSLLCSKIEDMMNSVVRQISFSNFERRIHGDGQRRSPTELDQIWLEETSKMYGQSGKVFTYEHAEHLWSYIDHFHRPFYVYGYAFGELLTQSLFAKQGEFGAKFEPNYIAMLQAGSTKNATELLQPFGLNPADPSFWEAGIKNSFGTFITQAEQLWAEHQK